MAKLGVDKYPTMGYTIYTEANKRTTSQKDAEMNRNELIKKIEDMKADPNYPYHPLHAKTAILEDLEQDLAEGNYEAVEDVEPADFVGRMNYILRRNGAQSWTDEQIEMYLSAPRKFSEEETVLRPAVSWLKRSRKSASIESYKDGSLDTTSDSGNF